jgi:hypothetical protein
LAVAAALKATPLLFLPYLLLRRRFAAALGFSEIFLGASFLPDLFFTQEGGGRVGLALLALSFLLATATSNDLAGSQVTTWAYRNNLIELGALILIPYLAIVIWPRKERAAAGELREAAPSA